MKRLPFIVAAVLALAGCNKPSEENCRKALANMQHLMGTENVRDAAYLEGEVRRCKGGSKKKAVDCAIKAATLEELSHCDFYKVPLNAKGVGTPDTDSTGSAGSSAPAGSAAPAGAAPAGSAAPMGSAAPSAGSAGGSDTGSAAAAGSATGGSAAAGSAAGSAAAGSAK